MLDTLLLQFFQFNLTRKLGFSRSGVVRPREACASPVWDFLAERICCGTFFSDDDRAITLPLWASPSKLHLTFQPQHCWPCSEEPQRAKHSLRRDTWLRRSREPLLSAQRLRKKKKKQLCGQKHQNPLQTLLRSSRSKAVRHQDALHCQCAPQMGFQVGAVG